MSTAWNKMTQPDASNPWNLIPDIQAAIKSGRVVIPVSGTAERGDGSTNGLALVYGGPLPVPTLVYRLDIDVYESWNGVAWLRPFSTIKHAEFTTSANTQATTAGSGYNSHSWNDVGSPATQNNTFCQQDPSAPTATDGSGTYTIGQIKILESGIYSIAFEWQPSSSPPSQVLINITLASGSSRTGVIANVERPSTYGDSGAMPGHPGLYLAANDKFVCAAAVNASSFVWGARLCVTKLQG